MLGFGLFSGYTEFGVSCLLEEGQVKTLKAGEMLFREQDAPEGVFLVLTGVLQVFVERQQQEVILNTMPSGTIVGELGVLCSHPRAASVRALEPTTVLRWENGTFRRLLVGNFSLFERIFSKAVRVLIERETASIDLAIRERATPNLSPSN